MNKKIFQNSEIALKEYRFFDTALTRYSKSITIISKLYIAEMAVKLFIAENSKFLFLMRLIL